MEKNEFRKILFDTACATMACDGSIDDSEIQALKKLSKTSTYFKNLKLADRLSKFRNNIDKNPSKTIENTLKVVKEAYFEPLQELILLEVILLIVYADVKIHPKEIEYLQTVRSFLNIEDQTIINRFGEIEALVSKNDLKSNKKTIDKIEYNEDDFEDMYFGIDPNKK